MTSPNPTDAELRRLLERSRPVADYDVEAGLARHRTLLAQGAPPPEWIRSVVRARRMSGAWLLSALGAALLLAGVLWQRERSALAVATSAGVAQVARASSAAPPGPSVGPLALAAAPAVSETAAPSAAAIAEPVTISLALVGTPESEPAARSVSPLARANARVASRALLPAAAHTRAARNPEHLVRPAAAALAPSVATAAPAQPDVGAVPPPAPATAGPSNEPEAALPEPAHQAAPEAIDPEVLEEMQQLASAERLLPTMPSRTLSMVRDGMQRFPHGYLTQERRYLEIMALLGLRMPKDAELLSRNFFRDYPKGPYRRKVERALEDGAR